MRQITTGLGSKLNGPKRNTGFDIDAASEIKNIIAQKKIDPNEDPISEVNKILKEYIIELMQPLEKQKFFEKNIEKFKVKFH